MVTPAPFSFRWLGTAGFDLHLGTARLLIDPFVSRSPQARPALPLKADTLQADAILITHGHLDHAYDVPALARQTRAPVYASISVCEMLHDLGVPARQTRPLAGGRTCRVNGVRIRAVLSRHIRFDWALVWGALRRVGSRFFELARQFGAYPCGEVLAYRLTVGGREIAHLGSAGWYQEEWKEVHPEVAMLPLTGHSRIHHIALRMVQHLQPQWVIPHHHDDFYPPLSQSVPVQPFVTLLQKHHCPTRVVEPRIGEWMPLFPQDYPPFHQGEQPCSNT